MFGGMDPKQMAQLMRQMGIKSEEIDAGKVVIEKKDGSRIVVENPQVQQIEMKGQKSFQISGQVKEEESEGAEGEEKVEDEGKSDVEIVMEECHCTKEQAEKALNEADGDLAQAILRLKGE